MKSLKITLALLFFSYAIACAANGGMSDQEPRSVTTRIFYGDCIRLTEEEMAKAGVIPAIAAAVVPSLVSNTIDRFGRALHSAGEAESFTVTGQRNIEVAPGEVNLCMQWVRGRLLDEAPEPTARHLTGLEDEESDRLAELGIYLAEAPELFIELRLRPSADRTALAVAPTYVEYNRLLKGRNRNKNLSRGLAVQISFNGPGKTPASATAVGTSLVLGDFIVGTHHRYSMPHPLEDGFELESPWFPTFSPPPMPATATEADTDPQLSEDTFPMTVTATVAETRDANQFLLFLADVFEESKGDLKEALEIQLIKQKRDKAELEALKESEVKIAAYYTKYADAETNVIEYCNANREDTVEGRKERLSKSRDAYIAQGEANLSAVSAGIPKPYERLIIVSDALPACR